MHRRVLPIALAAPAVAVAVAVAGCGGGSGYNTAAAAKPAPTSAARPAASIGTRHTPVGTILVDAQGRTLYLFEHDKGTTSSCYDACAAAWPPLTTGADAKAAGAAKAGKLGTSKRTDGTSIVTYGGHPLYTYSGDAAPGDTNGQGLDQFGAEWYVVAPGGDKIDED
jgi:predicted lipoprotein with Yx(FWY)xxD motif